MLNVLAFEKDFGIPHNTKMIEVTELMESRVFKINQGRLSHLSDEELQKYYILFKKGNEKTTRFEHQKEFQIDRKFLYHVLRLYDEAEQILLDGDLDLQRAKETMKAVRRGEWTLDQIKEWMFEKDKALESAYATCKLQERPDEKELQKVLMSVLEEHYGSLQDIAPDPDWALQTLRDIDQVLQKSRGNIYK
jgi:Asp-tRNA(Asn)/Glu-tRNA(Gln) amidotransferase B subunit